MASIHPILVQKDKKIVCADLHQHLPWIVVSSTDQDGVGALELINHETGEVVEIDVFGVRVSSAKFINHTCVVAGDAYGRIHLYDFQTREKLLQWEAHEDDAITLAAHPNCQSILSFPVTEDGIKLWEREQGWTCSRKFEGHSSVVKLAFNPKDATSFASVSADKTVKLWNLKTGQSKFTLPQPRRQPTFTVEKIHVGHLISLCSKKSVRFYDWDHCSLVGQIAVHGRNLFWAESGDLLAIEGDTSLYMYKYSHEVFLEQHLEDAFELLNELDGERVIAGIWAGGYFIYHDSQALKYCSGGEVTILEPFVSGRRQHFVGYLEKQCTIYLIDVKLKVSKYSFIEHYKNLLIDDCIEKANRLLQSVLKDHLNSVARSLESPEMIEKALEVATDPYYRFELAM